MALDRVTSRNRSAKFSLRLGKIGNQEKKVRNFPFTAFVWESRNFPLFTRLRKQQLTHWWNSRTG